jgi:hypothetical protein
MEKLMDVSQLEFLEVPDSVDPQVETTPQDAEKQSKNTAQFYLVHHGQGNKQITKWRYTLQGRTTPWMNTPAPIGATCPVGESFQSCANRSAWGLVGDIPCDVAIQLIELSALYPNGTTSTLRSKQPATFPCGSRSWLSAD